VLAPQNTQTEVNDMPYSEVIDGLRVKARRPRSKY
jgi:hypothetical protein